MLGNSIFDAALMCDVIIPMFCHPDSDENNENNNYKHENDTKWKRDPSILNDYQNPPVPLSLDKFLLIYVIWAVSICTSLLAVRRLGRMRRTVIVLHVLYVMLHVSDLMNATTSALLFYYEQNVGFPQQTYEYVTHCRLLLWTIRSTTIISSTVMFITGILRFLHWFVGSSIVYYVLASIKVAYFAFIYILIFCTTLMSGDVYIRSIGVCHRDEMFYCYLDRETYLRDNYFTTTGLPLIAVAFTGVPLVFCNKNTAKRYRNGQRNPNYFEILSRKTGLFMMAYHLLSLVTSIPLRIYVVCGENCFRNYSCLKQWMESAEGLLILVIVLTLYACLQLTLHSTSVCRTTVGKKLLSNQRETPWRKRKNTPCRKEIP